VKLDGEIRDASSRARLAPIAEQRLNMHVPSPDQVIVLPPPSAAAQKPRP
jgi:cell division protein FtsL